MQFFTFFIFLTAAAACNAQCGIRWRGRCDRRRSLRLAPINEKLFADISDDLGSAFDDNFESSGNLKNPK